MIGVQGNKGEKAKIILEIPKENFQKYRENIGKEKVDRLLQLNKVTVPEEGPYKIILDKFYIERISESNLDRTQVVESNEFPMFFAFGKGAETHNYQLRVLNGKKNIIGEDADWLDIFEDFYSIARPHIILDYELRMDIYLSDRKITGIWYNMSYEKNAEMDKVISANFKFFVLNKKRRVKIG